MGNNLFCSPRKKLLHLGLFQLFVFSNNKNVLLDGLCNKNKGLHTYGNVAVNKLTTNYSAS